MRVHPVIKGIIIVVLIAALAFSYFLYQKKSGEASAHNRQLTAQATEYENKIKKLEKEIETKKASLAESRETGDFIVSFVCATEEDLTKVKEFSAKYGFKPAVVFDCNNVNEESFPFLLEAIKEVNYEVMLTSSPVSTENINNTRQKFTDAGYTNLSGIFFLRNDDVNQENIKAICNTFMGYTQYSAEVGDGITEDGMVYFDYSRVSKQAVTEKDTRHVYAVEGHDVLMYCFDLTTPELTDEMITSSLDAISISVRDGNTRFSTIAEGIADVRSLDEMKKTQNAEYEAFKAEKEAEIEECNTKIREIYKS